MTERLWVDAAVALAIHERLLDAHGGAAGLRDRGLLDSALARPQQHAAYGESDICELAAVYADAIIRNHPFVDGNKRTGFVMAVLFLELNGRRFTASEEHATAAVLALAAGETDARTFAAWLRADSEAA